MTSLRRSLIILSAALFSQSTLSQDQSKFVHMFANITARMVEDGRTDNNRLYLFYFTYSEFGNIECDVRTLLITNLMCSKDPKIAVLPFTAPWIAAPRFCDRRQCADGVGRFSCARKILDDGKFEYTFQVPAGLTAEGRSVHKLVMQMKPYRIFEYSGFLSNDQEIDRTIKFAEYIPLVSKSDKDWLQEVELGCSKIAVPVIPSN